MSNLKRAADRVAQDMVDEGIAPGQIGLLMSQKTHERLFGYERNAPNEVLAHIAAGAVFLPALGMVAAGPLLDELSGLPQIELAAALKLALGVNDEEAKALADDVSAGGLVVVGSLPPMEKLKLDGGPEDDSGTLDESAYAEVAAADAADSSSSHDDPADFSDEDDDNGHRPAIPVDDECFDNPEDPQVRRFSLLELD